MSIPVPEWLLILLLILGSGVLIWALLIFITFIGLWALHPRDAHDDLIMDDTKGKGRGR